MTGSVLVLGASGGTGRRVVARLREAGVPVRAASRTSPVTFDWSAPATWRLAVAGAGAGAVFLVEEGSPSAEATGAFARLAADAGVATIVLLSSREAELPGYERHLAAEQAVRECGTGWTVLRPSWFAQNFLTHFGAEVRSGLLRLPTGTGREPFIDVDDVAAVAVAALTGPEHLWRTYDLSGPQTLSYQDAVARVAALTGVPARFEPVSEAEYVRILVAGGMPEDQAVGIAMLYRPVASGRDDHVSDGVSLVLARPPRSFDDAIRASLASSHGKRPQ